MKKALIFALALNMAFANSIQIVKIQNPFQQKPANTKTTSTAKNQINSNNNLSVHSTELSKTQQQNSRLFVPVSINVQDVPFEYLTSLLSSASGIPIVLRSFYAGSSSAGSSSASPSSASSSGSSSGNSTTGASSTSSSSNSSSAIGLVSFYAYREPLYYVLNELCGMYDLFWKYENGMITIYRYQRAIFALKLPALSTSLNMTSNNFTLKYQQHFIKNLQQTLQSLLTDSGSTVSITSTGYVVVRARPSEIRTIKKVVEKINRDMSTVIPLRITVFVVQLNHNRNIGLNLFHFAQHENGLGNITVNGNIGTLSSAGNNSSASSSFTLGIANLTWNAIYNMLTQAGNTKIVEDTELNALNYQPIAYIPETQQTILSNIQLTFIAGSPAAGNTANSSGTVPTITTQTENITTGNDLIIVPYTLNSNNPDKIVIDMYRSQKSLLALTPYQVDLAGYKNHILLPTLQSTTNIQQSVLQKGQSMVLLSDVMTANQIERAGIPFLSKIPVLGYLFGQKNVLKSRYQFVIVISYM